MSLSTLPDKQLHAALADGALLLAVNQRLARHYQYAHAQWRAERAERVWESPAIHSYTGWLKHWYADSDWPGKSALLPELLDARLWQSVVDDDERLSLLDNRSAADRAREARLLSQRWQIANDSEGYLSDDHYTFEQWQQRVLARMSNQGWVDAAALPGLLMEQLKESGEGGVRQCIGASCVVLAGFVELTPQLKTLSEALQSAGAEVLVLQPGERAAIIERRPCRDDQDELKVLARELRDALESARAQGQAIQLGVVVADLGARLPALKRALDAVFFPGSLPSEIENLGRPWDFSLGTPLEQEPVVRDALTLIELVVHGVRPTALSTLLMSPHFAARSLPPEPRQWLDRRLRRNPLVRIELRHLLDLGGSAADFAACLSELLKSVEKTPVGSGQWALRFDRWLSALEWPGEGLDSRAYQARDAFWSCLEDLRLLDDQPLGSSAALALLRHSVRQHGFQAEQSRKPITILGRLESHGLPFDTLWITGLDSENWPATSNPNPFLSIAAQREAGVPEASASAALLRADAEFEMWQRQCQRLIALHAEHRNDNALMPASIVRDVPATPAATHPDDLAARVATDLPTVAEQDEQGTPLEPGSELGGGVSVFRNQAYCPFRAFAIHRLGARELEDAEPGLDARAQGDLVHNALENFWKQTGDHASLLALDADARQERIAACVDDALAAYPLAKDFRALEQSRVADLIEQWLIAVEGKREPFTVVATEQQDTFTVGGLKLTMKIDRIDDVDGQRVVIDYKTGTNNKPAHWNDERLSEPQLPLYACVAGDIHGIAWAEVAPASSRFKGVTAENSVLPQVGDALRDGTGWSDLMDHWQHCVGVLANEISEGHATVTPIKRACDYCALKPLCRIDESSAPVATVDDPESQGGEVNPYVD